MQDSAKLASLHTPGHAAGQVWPQAGVGMFSLLEVVEMLRTAMVAIILMIASMLLPRASAQTVPSIRIVAPRNGAAVSGNQMVVEVRIQDFTLNPMAIGKPTSPGEGHWYVYVDGKFAGLSTDDVVSIPNDAYPSLAAGKHTIRVELRNNDHTPVAGAESAEIMITIPSKSAMHYAPASGRPGIKILVPHDHAAVSSYLIVWVKVRGFKGSPMELGTAAKPGEGNWQLSVDGKLSAVSTSSVADIRLTRGKHTLKATLHNNDFGLVAGASSDQIAVTVR